MLNENKIKMMTKMAIYEKNEGRQMIKNSRYFKGDYVAFGVLRTLIATTFAYIIMVILYVLCNLEKLVADINSLDYAAVGKRLGIYYILMLIVYTIIAAMVYAYQYNHSRKVFLLELKEGFKKFYNKYDTYLVPAVRFVMALVSFLMLNASIGYMSKLKNPLIAVAMAVLCAFLPNGFMIFFLSVFMLVHLYAISAEFALIVLGIVLLMYLLYYRFTPKQGYLLVITVLLCWIKMPYLLPIAAGLCFNAFAMIPAAFGVIIFYIIKTASEYETALTTKSVNDSMQQISYIVESLFNNKEMILFVIAMVVTITAVYAVRRLKIDNAWTYAIAAGIVVQFIVLLAGILVTGAKINLILMIVGTVLGGVVGYLCQILFFSVDYSRTEYVQYEDDEYYYYVKAVPKINIVNAEVKVKQINARKTKKAHDISDMTSSEQDDENI